MPAIRSRAGYSLLGLIGALLAFPLAALSAQDRIQGPLERSRTVLLKGRSHPRVKPENDRGTLDPSVRINQATLVLHQTDRQAADLERFLEEQRNPSSPDYRRWLTPEEYGELFGISMNDLARITAWLESESLTVDLVARGRNWIGFSGTAAQIGAAFRTELRQYEADGELHFANATDPSVPAALAGVIGEVRGLDDFRPKPLRTRQITPEFNASNGSHYLAPDDLAAIYNITPLYKAGFDGTGQKLAIVGQTAINLADIRGFRSYFSLPAKDPQLVLYGTNPGVSSGDQVEADLDLEWSGAVARNATILYVYSRDVITSLQYAIDQNLAPVISMSYGGCESGNLSAYRTIAQQANAQGITWMNSSGDSGAAGCDYQVPVASHGPAVIFPADVPEVTAVGGTEFAESGSAGWAGQNGTTMSSATGYLPEKAWNDTSPGSGIWATGGGASNQFPKPWWQSGPGVPNDHARDVPDISLTASGAHDGYLIFYSGGLGAVGGTSASSPAFAGLVSLINQYVVSKGTQAKAGLGNINPNLYNLAQNTTGIIHDITAGDNIVPCASGSTGCPAGGSFGYRAGAGYDLVTGLGSVDAYNLVTRWSSAPAGVGTTMTLAPNPAGIAAAASTALTATVTPVSGTSAPAGSVAFTLGGTQLGSAAVAISGTTGTATLSVKGSSLAVGANTITASYTAAGNFANSSATATVTITAPPVATTTTVTTNPASFKAAETTQVTATVRPGTGAAAVTGSVTFAVGTTLLGSVPLAVSAGTAVATLAVKGSSLAIGGNTVTATYVPSGNFAGSTAAVAVTVTPPPVATTTTVAASPANIATAATTQITVTIKPASGSTAPSGGVTFAAGNTSLGTASLTASGANGTAMLAVKGSSLAVGANTITATFAPSGNFGPSSATATVTVTAPPVATSATVTAAPASIPATETTQVTATVKPASGTAPPAGSVSFAIGGTVLGTVPLAALAANAAATLPVRGSSLTIGVNSITATYVPSGNFTASSATVTVIVTPPAAATAMTLVASPASILATATTLVTATVKPAGGTAAPTGSVTFVLSGAVLGTSSLTASGANSSATLAVQGSRLSAGPNNIYVTYTPAGNFVPSMASVTVTLTLPHFATTASVAANPANFRATETTQVTATVRPATGTTAPTGSVIFAVGGTVLGTAPLAASAANTGATLAVKGSSLAPGSNTITATYIPAGNFTGSSATVSVTVTPPAVATTATLVAAPAGIAATATTQVTATVRPASGSDAPTGSVTFAVGNTTLGSAPLAASGATASGTVVVSGGRLAVGANTITATFVPTGNFAPSAAMAAVTVTPPPAGTAVTVAASPASIGTTDTTQVTATVRPASGAAAPTGSVAFSLGGATLGTAPLAASGANSTATLGVKGSSLVMGINTVTATYLPSGNFTGSVGIVTVTVAAGGSKVVPTVTVKPATSQGLPVAIRLQETGGVTTTLTGFSMAGTDFRSAIGSFFGTAQIPARGTLTANLFIQWPSIPSSLVLVFSGVDAGGKPWTQTVTSATR